MDVGTNMNSEAVGLQGNVRKKIHRRQWLGKLVLGGLFASVLIAGAGSGAEAEPSAEAEARAQAIPGDRVVVAWGWSLNGQTQVPAGLTGKNIKALDGGAWHSLALTEEGKVFAWGANSMGQAVVPAELRNKKVTAIAAGYAFSLALTSEGRVIAWGDNSHNQSIPPPALTGKTVTAIAAGYDHALALTSEGELIGWGSRNDGQGQSPPQLTGKVVTAIAAGGDQSSALTSEGESVSWGRTNTGLPVGSPPPEMTGKKVVALDSGRSHFLALTSEGTVYTWGSNDHQKLDVPAGLEGKVSKVVAGDNFSLALTHDGIVVAWGEDQFGQTQIPADLTGKKAVTLGAGSHHSLVAAERKGISEIAVSSGYVLANGVSTQTARVTLLEQDTNAPLPGISVDFSVPSNVSASASSAVTNAQGVAEITLKSSVIGEYPIRASINGIPVPAASEGNDVARFGTAPVLDELVVEMGSGFPGEFTIPVSGTPGPDLSVTSNGGALPGTLPVGLSLNAGTGLVSGTLFVPGEYPFEVTAKNALGSMSRAYTVTVSPVSAVPPGTAPGLSVSSGYVLADGVSEQTATVTVATQDTNTPVAGVQVDFAAATGAVLSDDQAVTDSSGKASVTVTSSSVGDYPVTATIGDTPVPVVPEGNGVARFGLLPVLGAVSFEAGSGFPGAFTLPASGSPAYVLSVTSNGGVLPAGLSFDAETGVVSGTLFVPGEYSFEITSTNALGSVSRIYTVTVNEVDEVPPGTNPGLSVSPGYVLGDGKGEHTATVTVENPNTLVPVAGVLVDFVAAEGAVVSDDQVATDSNGSASVTVTSSVAGDYPVTATIGDTALPAVPGGNTVAQFGSKPVLDEVAFEVDSGFLGEFTIPVSGTPGPDLSVTSNGGVLPAGLSFDAETGVVSGTLFVPGEYVFEMTATNVLGSVSRTYTVTVNPIDKIPPGTSPVLEVSSGHVLADGVSEHAATVTVINSDTLVPVAGVRVGFTAPEDAVVSENHAVTDDKGQARVSMTSSVVGNYQVTASIGSTVIPAAPENNDLARFGSKPGLNEVSFETEPGSSVAWEVPVTGVPAPVVSVTDDEGEGVGDLPLGLSFDAVTGVISGTLTDVEEPSSGVKESSAGAKNASGTPAGVVQTRDAVSVPQARDTVSVLALAKVREYPFELTADNQLGKISRDYVLKVIQKDSGPVVTLTPAQPLKTPAPGTGSEDTAKRLSKTGGETGLFWAGALLLLVSGAALFFRRRQEQ
ncbi:Ig-like domain-containing protein [Lysinibacter sp. HNR]|uniref:Ig-like domain-containing protein n=1 Tax=Lysinibacter sp. HNR TaxID=3031408 RepID=UPI0024353714|nr:Ig-like domain-containing protein [Lysinibacter sp. HNR]WGD37962.1 Ig-like domain-containing protein [Lysinibacter sp. HNR]